MASLELGFRQDIYYDCKNPIPVKDVIRSLQGLDAITNALPEALNKLLHIEIKDIEIALESVEIDSEWIKYLAFLNFESAEDEERFFRKFGKKHPMIRRLINISILAILLLVVYRSLLQSDRPAVNVHATNSIVIAAGADIAGISPEAFQSAIESAVKSNPKTTNGVTNFLAPTRNDPESSIEFGRSEGVILGPEAIAEIPLQLLGPDEFVEREFTNVLLDIRATDLDYRNKGWSVLAAGFEKRLPATIYPHIEPAQLVGTVYANVGVLYKQDPESLEKLLPTNIIIKSLGSRSKPPATISAFVISNEQIDVPTTIEDHSGQQKLFN